MKKCMLWLLTALFVFGCFPSFARGEEALPKTTSGGLSFTLPEAVQPYESRLTDGYVMSRIALTKKDAVGISLDREQSGLLLSWYAAPGSYRLTQADAGGAVLSEETVTDGYLNRYVPLKAECRSVTLDRFDEACALSGVACPSAETSGLQRWQPAPEKADILLVAAAPGLEFRSFSGLLPRYTVANGVTTAIVFLSTHEKRERVEESLSALWELGIRQYPVFGPMTARNYDSEEILTEDWRESAAVDFLTEQILRFRPEVVVTHGELPWTDANGKAHAPTPEERMTGAFVRKAIEQAADTWQVKKLYQCEKTAALETAGTAPDMSKPLNALKGASPLLAAQTALDGCPSLTVTGSQVETDRAFLLTATTVGADAAKDDLLEHIDTSSLVTYKVAVPSTATAAKAPKAAAPEKETVLIDEENGHWAYQNAFLQIEINRVSTEINHAPVVYFAADIRMTNIHQFRPVFGSLGHTGKGRTLPWKMARENKCVLWLTGDNMLSDEREEKGALLRDGRIYSKLRVEDSLALYPDMSLRILKKNTPGAQELLEDGVENAFSFGPTLIENGVLNEKAVYHRVRRINPRTGIGMYEPGHYLAIVVDGRQRKQNYSAGMTIETFAALFQEYGVTTAYNLDGGLSAAMLFMGEQLNSHGGNRSGEKNDISYQRSVPDGLGFGYSELVPGVDDPISNTGNIKKNRG